ncbi:hypothetical protein CFC21_088266 [Triticum aestivum]|uniref:Uncharacterized protein n=3 Tax=Triticum TaxID=4564 RepID=A0A9R0YPB9_TRITD|nr:uncharacterized protein LOC119323483 [Triticum dicoccoides]XP_044412972.1 uncharacterized protein LOC123137325 [Triticum aestivum]KAF7084721.1 hypothetical protein CFC21_088266 [Triticum aestivum]VAI58039.1 unnamed protein product [Triticum turgidum subsp. durum]
MKSSADDVDIELVKAVAQAWYAHSGNPRPSRAPADDDDGAGMGARRAGAPRYRPSRFKLEAAAAAAAAKPPNSRPWDFTQSLWDTYELVTVAQKIESSLAIVDEATARPARRAFTNEDATRGGGGKRARESRRSLRSLFRRSSSRRFEESSS